MKSRILVKLLLVGLLIVSSLGITVSAETQVHVTAVLKTLANPFWVVMQQGLLEEAIKDGIAVQVLAVPTEQDVVGQLNLLETALLSKPAVLLVSPITSRNLLPALNAAASEGIPIIDLDGNLRPVSSTIKEGVTTLRSSIASNNYEAGSLAAKFIIDKLQGHGKVIAISGISGNVTGETRVKGFVDTIKKEAPNIEVIGTFAGDWDRLKAANITDDALTANPDLAGIYCANDTMALGAVEAVFAAGKGGQVTVVGTDGIKDARDSIMAGRLSATVAQLPYLMGKMAIDTAVKIMKGEKVDLVQSVPLLLLTKKVIEAGTDPLLKYIK